MNRQRLAQEVRKRRLELGLRQSEIGVSPAKAGQIERAEDAPIAELTKAKLTRALGWSGRSVDLVLAGGEPELVSVAPLEDYLDARVAFENRKEARRAAVDAIDHTAGTYSARYDLKHGESVVLPDGFPIATDDPGDLEQYMDARAPFERREAARLAAMAAIDLVAARRQGPNGPSRTAAELRPAGEWGAVREQSGRPLEAVPTPPEGLAAAGSGDMAALAEIVRRELERDRVERAEQLDAIRGELAELRAEVRGSGRARRKEE
jgi:transcriptional regulator with XRE-family HTH domain